jgi:Alanine dehydrogenase/PNT, N-terminal domain
MLISLAYNGVSEVGSHSARKCNLTPNMNGPASSPASPPLQIGHPCIGVRREDKNRWERRAPLSPDHVTELVKRGITVLVQPSNLRTHNDKTYREVQNLNQSHIRIIINTSLGGCNHS